MRQTKSPTWQHVMISNTPTPAVFVEIKDGSSQFPLYLYDEFKGTLFAAKNTISSVNIFESPITYWFSSMGASASWLEQARSANLITPDEVLYYAYAILHSPSYRQRYVEFLKIDFPRLPLTSNIELFRELCALGKELVGLHLLEFETRSNDFSRFVRGQRATEVATTIAKGYPKYAEGRVHVNESDYFAGVPNDVWEFHIGGYQVCHKWLKDRRGRQLSKEDIAHYKKIVNALGETIRLMGEVDAAIESAGGWPMK
jgi:predicted helicase